MTACSRGLGTLCVKEYLLSGDDALETAVGADEGVLSISIQESNCPDTHLAGNYLYLYSLFLSLSLSVSLSLARSLSLFLSVCVCIILEYPQCSATPQILTPLNLTETLLWS